MYINDPKCLRMSQHHLGLHNIQLVFHFCLYMPCDTNCRTFLEWLKSSTSIAKSDRILLQSVTGIKKCDKKLLRKVS